MALGLGPLWAFRHLPTQDGPSHVLNARVFQACGDPQTPEAEFFERRLVPLPNWTAPALLGLLTPVLPPLVAEKVLVSLYLVGLPLALAYFLAAIDASGAAALGLLLLWNRCLFLGFYNYCLGLGLLFLTLGWFLRLRDDDLGPRSTVGLSALLVASYFTHLVAFGLTAFCLLWLAAARPGVRSRRVAAVLAATAPPAILALHFLVSTGFFGSAAAPRAMRGALAEAGRGLLPQVAQVPNLLHRELFAVHAGAWPLGLLALLVCALLWSGEDGGAPGPARWRWPILGLSATLLVAFALVPEHLGAQGGFLRARLAPVPFLLALGALPRNPEGPLGLRHAAVAALIVVNLGLVVRHVAERDREIEAFTAAVGTVQEGETLVAVKAKPEPTLLVDPFAAEYYCLATRAVCLSNYEGATRHFPVRLRPGVKDRIKRNRAGSFWANVVLCWDAPEDAVPQVDEPYREVLRQGKLRVFRRQ